MCVLFWQDCMKRELRKWGLEEWIPKKHQGCVFVFIRAGHTPITYTCLDRLASGGELKGFKRIMVRCMAIYRSAGLLHPQRNFSFLSFFLSFFLLYHFYSISTPPACTSVYTIYFLSVRLAYFPPSCLSDYLSLFLNLPIYLWTSFKKLFSFWLMIGTFDLSIYLSIYFSFSSACQSVSLCHLWFLLQRVILYRS